MTSFKAIISHEIRQRVREAVRRFDEFGRLIFGNFERKGFLRTPQLMN